MADTRTSLLTALAGADAAADDVLPIVDTSASSLKKITIPALREATGIDADLAASSGSSLVGFIQSGTGAVARTAQDKGREVVSVKDFGAVGDGVTDDTAAIQAAIDRLPANGGVITFPDAALYLVSSLNVNGKQITLDGGGSTIICSDATNGAIYKTDHGYRLTVTGLNFSGNGKAINHNSAPATTSYDELNIENCSFTMGSGIYGVYSIGTRNANIYKCSFFGSAGGNGIYFKDSVQPYVGRCIFKGAGYAGRAVYYPGVDVGTDAGLILENAEIMGWDKGVEVIGCDMLVISGGTIDYNNYSIKLAAQDRAHICGGAYIGSLGDNPAIWITSDASVSPTSYCTKIIIENITLSGHSAVGNLYDCILIDGTGNRNIQIKNNNITFWTRYGINFTLSDVYVLQITGNIFSSRSGFGVSPVYNSSGANDSGLTMVNNAFGAATTISALNLTSNCKTVNDNYNLTLKANGQATILSGGTSITFAHGISGYTPTSVDVVIVPTNAAAAAAGVSRVSAIDATNCTIAVPTAVTANAGFAYQISRYKP